MPRLLIILCLLAATACTQSPTAPAAPLASQFVLAPGDSRVIAGTPLTVRFNDVTGDSRCPADAICIQGGSAQVRLTVLSNAGAQEHRLLTGDMLPVRHEEFTIELVQLEPYPFSSRTIRPDEYRATLRVTR